MMFDSRSLKNTNFYFQKFPDGGALRYEVTNPVGGAVRVEYRRSAAEMQPAASTTSATGGDQQPRQHHLRVSREGRMLQASQPESEVSPGDVVMWSADDRTVPGFAVRGQVGNFQFDSSALSSGAVFTNAFGTAGDYEWRDANGSGIGGMIHVVNPRIENADDQRKWMEMIQQGQVIVINGQTVEPGEVEVVVGQTVFWAVEKADGITITDVRLLK